MSLARGKIASGLRSVMVRTYPDRDTDGRWREFLRQTPMASHFVAPEYFLEPTVRGRSPFALLVERRGEIVACLTGRREGRSVVSGLSAHPQFVVLDVEGRQRIERAIASSLLAERRPASLIVVYSWFDSEAFRKLGFRSRVAGSTYVIDLNPDEEALFRKLDGKRRNTIRSATKSELSVREASPDDVPVFYRLLVATHSRLGVGPPLEIDRLLTPGTNRKLLVAYWGDTCVAGSILRYHGDGLAEYSDNASLPEFWRLRPNDLLLWEGVRWAKRIGCRVLNLGGHNFFKKGFGGALCPIVRMSRDLSWLRWHEKKDVAALIGRGVYRAVRRVVPRAAGAKDGRAEA